MPIKEMKNEQLSKLSKVMKECGIEIEASECNGDPYVTIWIEGLSYSTELAFVCYEDIERKIIK